MNLVDLFGGLISFILTLCVFSYLIGDNQLFRLAVHIFVGVAAGFVTALTIQNVLWPHLFRPLIFGTFEERLWSLVPVFLSAILFAKAIPRLSILPNPVLAFMVGIGAATAIGGAIFGTLFPQTTATIRLFDTQNIVQVGKDPAFEILNSGLILLGVIITLGSFQFGTRWLQNQAIAPFWQLVFWGGRVFVAITFGVIYAGVFLAALSALTERLSSIVAFILSLISPAL